MNIALIIAGGSGKRTGQDIPKQFLNVLDKPIVVYTLEAFQRHPEIDAIAVVCLDGWQEILWAYARQFGIAKLKWVAFGGASGQESIRNGLYVLSGNVTDGDIVVLHDGIRPMVSERIVTSCIGVCKAHGNGISARKVTEQVFRTEDEACAKDYIPRESLRILQTPQAYRYGVLRDAYEKGFAQGIGIGSSAYANTLLADLGETLYFAEGSTKNIKITTREDIEIFKAMLQTQQSDWLK